MFLCVCVVRVCVRACLRPRLGLIRSVAIYSPRTGYIIAQDVYNTATQELYSPWYANNAPSLHSSPLPLSSSRCTAHERLLDPLTTTCYFFPPLATVANGLWFLLLGRVILNLHLHLPHHNWSLPQMTPTDRLPQASKLAHQTPTRLKGKTTSRRLNRTLCPCPTRPCLKQNQVFLLRLATSSQSPTRTRQPQATM